MTRKSKLFSGAMCISFSVKVFVLIGLLQWTQAKSQEVYGLEFQGTNSSFRTQQTLNSIISKLNSTLNSIPSKLNSTLNSIPTKLNSILNIIPTTINSILSGVLSLITTLTSLISKPSGGGGGGGIPFPDLSSLLGKLNGTGLGISKPGGGCDPDILLLSNLPGIFIVVPIAILAVSILVGAIAAAIIAFGGLGEHITETIYDKTDFQNIANHGNTNHKIDSTLVLDDPNYYDGKLQSGSASPSPYAASANNYGSASPSSSPWVYSAVDTLNKDFYKAYDKYSQVSQQQNPGQNGYFDQLSAGSSSNSNNQHWSSNHVARAKQR